MSGQLLWTGLFILVGLPALGASFPLIGGIVMGIGVIASWLGK